MLVEVLYLFIQLFKEAGFCLFVLSLWITELTGTVQMTCRYSTADLFSSIL